MRCCTCSRAVNIMIGVLAPGRLAPSLRGRALRSRRTLWWLLGLLLKRGDLKNGRDIQLTPEEARAYELPEAVRHRFLSREEYFDGIVFDKSRRDWDAGKVQGPTSEETDAAIIARLAILRKQRGWNTPLCSKCGEEAD